jgi:Spy/CpxP family protein refolding chaperone
VVNGVVRSASGSGSLQNAVVGPGVPGSPKRRSMMRSLRTVLALVVLTSVGVTLPADEETKKDRKGARERLVEKLQDLSLTEEQEASIAKIRKEYGPKVAKAGKEVAALVKAEVGKIREVLTERQKEKLSTLKTRARSFRKSSLAEGLAHLRRLELTEDEAAKLAEIAKEYRPRIGKAMTKLKGLLSDEQNKARLEALKEGKKRSEVIESLKLTDDQKEKVAAVGKELLAVVREELQKIADVLTAEEKAQLRKLAEEKGEHARDWLAHKIAEFKELALTDQQRARIAAIRNEYRPKIHKAGNQARAAAREELAELLAVFKE